MLTFHDDTDAEQEDDDEADIGDEGTGPSGDHNADYNELLGPHDEYFDPMAMKCAVVLRLQHRIAMLQHRRGEPETRSRMDQTMSLYQSAHDQATLNRATYAQIVKGLATRPMLNWSSRLDKKCELDLLARHDLMINSLMQQLRNML